MALLDRNQLSHLRAAVPIGVAVIVIAGILYCEEIVLYFDATRLSHEFEGMAAKADAIVVAIHFPHRSPSSEYFFLRDGGIERVLSEVRTGSYPAHRRDFASAYFITIFIFDNSNKAIGTIGVHPSEGMSTDTQLSSIIRAARSGDRRNEWSAPTGESFKRLLRKCWK